MTSLTRLVVLPVFVCGLVGAAASLFAQGVTTAPGKTTPPPLGTAPGKAATPPAAAAAPAAAPAGGPSNWTKFCGEEPTTKKQICILRYDFRTDQGQVVAQVNLQKNDALDKPPYTLNIVLPIGAFLPAGVTLTVDGKGKAIKADYQICLPQQVCVAEGGFDVATFDTVRKGSKLIMKAKNAQQKEMTFEMNLAGFSGVFDGPGAPFPTQGQR